MLQSLPFLYSLGVSAGITKSCAFGGLVMLALQITVCFSLTHKELPGKKWIKWTLTASVAVLLLFGGIIIGDGITAGVWAVMAVCITVFARDTICWRLQGLKHEKAISTGKYWTALGILEIALAGTALLTLWNNTPDVSTCIVLIIGYVITAAAQWWSSERAGYEKCSMTGAGKIWKADAVRKFDTVSFALSVTLALTLGVMFAFGVKVLPSYVVLGMVCVLTILTGEAVGLLFRRQGKIRLITRDLSNLLILGILLWIAGLEIFGKMAAEYNFTTLSSLLMILLVSLGLGLCEAWIGRMEKTMEQAVEFSTGAESIPQFRRGHGMVISSGVMVGEAVSLVIVEIMESGGQLHISMGMVLPVIAAAAAALVLALRLPLNRKYMEKLSRFLSSKQQGQENSVLRRQLETVVVEKHVQPFLVRFLTAAVRKILRHKLVHEENIHPNPDNPIIFLCNHGEMYGPLAAMANIPVDVRPWTMSELTVNKEEMAAYFYKYTVSQQRWIPKRLQMPIANIIAPACIWGMGQLESIPVYRNKLTELKKTFRLSCDALIAGDNLLIFPENPNSHYEGEGYVTEGVGDLFSGFAMLAPIYYNRTGKRARFLPMFCDSKHRTVTFGTEIIYNPDNDPMEERDRIVSSAKGQMEEMYKLNRKSEIGNRK